MKIVYFIPLLGCGGAEILLGAIIEQLINKNHEVLLITLEEDHQNFAKFPNRHFIENNVKRHITRARYSLLKNKETKKAITDLEHLIQTFSPDIIHSHLFQAELVSRLPKIKNCVYFSHGHDNMWQLDKNKGFTPFSKARLLGKIEARWLEKKYSETNTRFVAISNDVKKFLIKNLPGKLHRNIHLMPNGFDYHRFYCPRPALNEPLKKIKLISTGNLVAKKNHELLIKIGELLNTKGIDFSIEVLGFGPLLEPLKTLSESAGLSNQITFHGSVGNVQSHLSGANIYIHPATYEPFGLAILEAMAAGLPVVSMDGFGNRELIEDNANGFFIRENKADLFLEKIEFLAKNPDAYNRIASAGQLFAKSYDISNYTDRLILLYQNAVFERY